MQRGLSARAARERTHERIRKTSTAGIGPRTLRPPVRARLLRRGVRGPHPGAAIAQARRSGPGDRHQPAPPRRLRLRAQHRGRGGAADAGSRPLPEARDGGAGIRPAPGGAVRSGHAVPAAAAGRAAPRRGARRPRRRRGGPDPARLAGRPHRQQPAGGHRAPGRAGHPAGVHRTRPRPRRRPRRAGAVRAQALRHPPAHRARRRRPRPRGPRRVLRGQPVVADHRLQGHAHRRPGHHHVPGPRRPRLPVGDRARPLALQHQHVPVVAAVAPLPLHRPQRRDQHPARQHQLDAGARGAVRVGPAGGRPRGSSSRSSRRARATPPPSTTCSSSWP